MWSQIKIHNVLINKILRLALQKVSLFFIWKALKKRFISIFAAAKDAEVVELVDTLDSKSSASNSVRVRVPPSVLRP